MEIRLTPEAFAKPPGGVRRTAVNLLTALRAVGAEVSVSSLVEGRVTTTSPPHSGLQRAMLQIAEATFFASRRVRREDGIAHSLYYDQQLRPVRWPLVVTVHDMIHERFGEGGKTLRWAKRLSIARASLIVTPSYTSAAELLRVYPNVRPQVIVIPWGVAPEFLTAPRTSATVAPRPFLLYVGARSGYKNISVLLRALATARNLDDFRLVLVGGEPLQAYEQMRIVDAVRTADRLQHLPSPSDSLLRRLYDEAVALVVTSRCEGFGLPVLEAMARRCPVVCAEGGALAEVSDGHSPMFDPDSAAACADAIREAIGMPSALRTSGQMHARRYQWAATARAHVDAYRLIEY